MGAVGDQLDGLEAFATSGANGGAFVEGVIAAGGAVSIRFNFSSNCSVRSRNSCNSFFNASMVCASCAQTKAGDATARANKIDVFIFLNQGSRNPEGISP